jgi:hypothetical protein
MRVRAARRRRARDLRVPARCCAVLDRFPRFEPGVAALATQKNEAVRLGGRPVPWDGEWVPTRLTMLLSPTAPALS